MIYEHINIGLSSGAERQAVAKPDSKVNFSVSHSSLRMKEELFHTYEPLFSQSFREDK